MSRVSIHSLSLVFALSMAALSMIFVDYVKLFTTVLSIAGACAGLFTAGLMLYMDINPPAEEETASIKSTVADWGSFWSGVAVLLLVVLLHQV